MEGRKEPNLPELPELVGEEDGTSIVFLTVAVWHCTATSRHGLDSPLHHHPTYPTTTVSPRCRSPMLAAMDTPCHAIMFSPLGGPKAGLF